MLTIPQGKHCTIGLIECWGITDQLCRADHFDVTLQFLLQQAAWLYDRQLSQVRAQMSRVPTTQSTSTSPAPGSVSGSTALGQQTKGATNAGECSPMILIESSDNQRPSSSVAPLVTAER